MNSLNRDGEETNPEGYGWRDINKILTKWGVEPHNSASYEIFTLIRTLLEEAKADERKDRDEEWIMSMKLNGVDQKIIDEVVSTITPQAISAISNKK